MPPQTPLPQSMYPRLKQNQHPGLLLDKYGPTWDQGQRLEGFSEKVQRELLNQVAGLAPPELEMDQLRRRRDPALAAAHRFRCTTISPLTLHLARASAAENAGICLHPLYGFVYLPGSGLKGMARAYAEMIWLPTQADPQAAWRRIEDVFGWAPNPERKQHIDDPQHPASRRFEDDSRSAEITSCIGSIIFHDAWPMTWPRLIVDIVNNHHPSYYQGDEAPGDWDSPRPVYFLAVPAGQAFEFALAPRRAEHAAFVTQAREWLVGALTHLGAGAKTAAGYGAFRIESASPPRLPTGATCAIFEATLELATPAFLAGAETQGGKARAGCDLRSATLRGLLRWWWRAMHAGFVDEGTLRRLEAAVWGDTTTGGAVSLQVLPLEQAAPVLYDKQAVAREHRLPRTPDRKTPQGLWYHSYGMHDSGKQRLYLPPGTRWKVVLRARPGRFARTTPDGRVLPATTRVVDPALLLDQARVALWWLCMVGGVGSKARKGFGSFLLPAELEQFQGGLYVSKGRELRTACELPDDGFKPERATGPSIRQMVELGREIQPGGSGWLELTSPTTDIWQALDETGMAAQMFAKQYKHQREKCALGLPRRIGTPVRGNFRPGPGVQDRHASPVHYHLHGDGHQTVLRVAAFPAARLPGLAESREFLGKLLRHFLETYSPRK